MLQDIFNGNPKEPGKISLWHILLVFLLLTAVRPLLGSLFGGGPIDYSYSEFTSAVVADAVESVTIGAELIDGVLADGGSFRTVRVEDPSLLPILQEHGVAVRGRTSNNLLGWLFPLALMFGVTFWMMRRMTGGGKGSIGSGIFSFGKSKARLTEGEQSGVTFGDIGGAGEAVTDLREITEFLKSPDRFQRLGEIGRAHV